MSVARLRNQTLTTQIVDILLRRRKVWILQGSKPTSKKAFGAIRQLFDSDHGRHSGGQPSFIRQTFRPDGTHVPNMACGLS